MEGIASDKEHKGRPVEFEDTELEALLDQDSCQTQEEFAETLGVTQQAIKTLKAIGMVQKQENWVLYELNPRNIKHCFFMCEQLHQRQNGKGFSD